MSAAFISGSSAYKILQKYLPIPNEKCIRERFYPFINSYSEYLTNTELCDCIIRSLNVVQPLYVTVAIDAAKFKNVKGCDIKKHFQTMKSQINTNMISHLSYLQDDIVYKNVFVFHIQPINKNVKAFPIHIRFTESGSANSDIKKIFDRICKSLSYYNIIVKFVATDGDHYYDIFHDLFFKYILSYSMQ